MVAFWLSCQRIAVVEWCITVRALADKECGQSLSERARHSLIRKAVNPYQHYSGQPWVRCLDRARQKWIVFPIIDPKLTVRGFARRSQCTVAAINANPSKSSASRTCLL